MIVLTLRTPLLYYFVYFGIVITKSQAQDIEIISNALGENDLYGKVLGVNSVEDENTHSIREEMVRVNIYYESLCPDCRQFFTKQFLPVYNELQYYLMVNTNPYGNAKTIRHKNNTYDFECQHGPEECYGNKLHACAMDTLSNTTLALWLNICMMEDDQKGRGSNDAAADVCGASLDIDVEVIKNCARGVRGMELLKQYGDLSQIVGYNYVPYIVINNKVSEGHNFLKDVCQAFKNPPQPCLS